MNKKPRTYRTKSGRLLTEADLDALVVEAERGYDVQEMARRPGRPRIGSAPAAVVPVRLHAYLHTAAKECAAAESTSLSELVRDALRRYLAADVPAIEMRTRSGRVMSEKELDYLAAEADVGYDIKTVRGGTRLRTPGRAEVVPVRMPPELKAAVEQRAEAESTSVSEVVRAALRARLEGDSTGSPGGRSDAEVRHPPDVAEAESDRPSIEYAEEFEIACIWFFLPLPHPLGLPAGWRSEQPLTPREILQAEGPTSGLASSLLIHQLEPSVQPVLADMIDLWRFGIATMKNETVKGSDAVSPELFAKETAADLSALQSVRTIAEVALPGFTGEDERQVFEALDLAIDHVRFVQRSVAVATQKPLVLMSRATLPPTVPTFQGVLHSTRPEDPTPRLPELQTAIDYFIPDCAPPAALGLRPETFDEEMLRRLIEAADVVSRRAAFDLYADLRREALAQRQFGGNSRMALVALATAGEVLLDTALLQMLWEEHTAPTVAATYFDRNEGHTARVTRNFPPRLGGGWDAGSKSPAGSYLRDLVRLRHRVVHAGHEPTADELESAWSALVNLEHYLGDRLVAGKNLKRYTRTVLAWMGGNGLRGRNRWTRHVESLVDDPNEPNWIDTFRRWRLHVDRSLDESPAPPGAATHELTLIAEVLDDGTIRWIIHDSSTAHAALVDPLKVQAEDEIATTTEWLSSQASHELADRRVASLLDGPPPASLTWKPDHEVFPDLHIFPTTATTGPSTESAK